MANSAMLGGGPTAVEGNRFQVDSAYGPVNAKKAVHGDGGICIVPGYGPAGGTLDPKGLTCGMIQVVRLSKNLLVAPIWGQQPLDKTQAKL